MEVKGYLTFGSFSEAKIGLQNKKADKRIYGVKA